MKKLTQEYIYQLDEDKLVNLHGRLHAYWHRENVDKDLLKELHIFTLNALIDRNLRHKRRDDLDDYSLDILTKDSEDIQFTGLTGVLLPYEQVHDIVEGNTSEIVVPEPRPVAFEGIPTYLMADRTNAGIADIYGIITVENSRKVDNGYKYEVEVQEVYMSPEPVTGVPDKTWINNVVKRLDTGILDCASSLEHLVLVPDFISFTGSGATDKVDKEPNDYDMVVRAKFDEDYICIPKRELFMKFKRAFPVKLQDKIKFISSLTGPIWDSYSLCDLVLRFHEPKKREVDESYAYHKSTSEWVDTGGTDYCYCPRCGYKTKRNTACELLVCPRCDLQLVSKKFELMKPFHPIKSKAGYHKNEFTVGEEEELWATWAKGNTIVVEPKYDGIRMVIHRDGDNVKIFTEDKLRERQQVLPQVVDAVKQYVKSDKVILDAEFVLYENNKPQPREEMLELVVGKEPIKQDLRVFAHDCVYDGEPINEQGYLDRIKHAHEIIKDNNILIPSVYWVADNKEAFMEALKKAYEFEGSEGSMLKYADSKYMPGAGRTVDWAKIKKTVEYAGQIIGISKKAKPFDKKPKRSLTGQEAVETYKKLQEGSNAYRFRVAVLRNGKLIPMESKVKVAESMQQLKWNADLEEPKWQGLDDPEIWEIDEQFPPREVGDYSYATTYVKAFKDYKPKLGDIITVAPVRIDVFDGNHYSHMFPRVKEVKPERDKPDNIEDII